MARLLVHRERILDNIRKLDSLLRAQNKQWTLVVKALGTDKRVLESILSDPAITNIDSLGVSQWRTLKLIKEINPELRTMFIKPPSARNADKIVRYADVSLNSSLITITALNEAAEKQGIIHRIIVMIEMGELREGIEREGLIPFYKKLYRLKNIEVIGLGTNLGCMVGIQPTYDKMIQLVLYKQLLEAKFKHNLDYVSGASSITLPLLEKGKIPKGINHFRIGEAVFLGTSPLNNQPFLDLHTNAFTFEASILELYRKDKQPDGVISDAAVGHTELSDGTPDEPDPHSSSYRAIVDFGILDVDADHLVPFDPGIRFFGNSSDLTVYDLGENPNGYETGDTIYFKLKYLALAKLMYSRFVDKSITGDL